MRRVYPALLIASAFAFSAVAYGRLPERVPVHWNWTGAVDRHGGRLEGAFLLPMVVLLIWGLMLVLPKIDPRRANYPRFASTYDLVVNGVLTVMVLLHVMILGHALGWPIPVARVAVAMAGVLVIVTGNVLPRVRSNWWFGVRTPWTLSSEKVWTRTHRVAGYLMIMAGVVVMFSALLPVSLMGGIAMAALVIAGGGSVVYSYLVWREERSL